MSIRVLIADDHCIFRAGFSVLLSSLEGVQVIGEASNGCEAVRMVRTLAPDLVLMDIAMPMMSGIEATRSICSEYPDIRVIMLTMHDADEYVLPALRAGAAGYLTKDAGLVEIDQAIRAVMNGGSYISQCVSRSLVNYVRKTGPEEYANPLNILTPRQREILQRIAKGASTQRIAQDLNISIKTVETHRHQLMERLNISDTANLVRFAIRKGLVQVSD